MLGLVLSAINCLSCRSRCWGHVWPLFPLLVSDFDLAHKTVSSTVRREGKLFENILQRIDTRQHAHECYHIGLSRATFEQHLADWILIAMQSQRMKQNCRLVRFSSWILCTNENKKQDKSWSKNYAKFDQQRNRKKQEENVYYSSRVIN